MAAIAEKKSKVSNEVKPNEWPEAPRSYGRYENHLRNMTTVFEKDDRVRGWYRFNFVEQPGGLLEFTYDVPQPKGIKRHVYEKYRMEDQNMYYIPHDVAQHLNDKFVPKIKAKRGANGMIQKVTHHQVNRFYLIPSQKPEEEEE